MAQFNGGDQFQITWDNPTVGEGSGTFAISAGEDFSFTQGGLTTADDTAQITGDGRTIRTLTQSRWKIEGTVVWDRTAGNNTLFILQALSSSIEETLFTITDVHGVVYSGKGTVVGETTGNSQDSKIPVILSGGQGLTQFA